MPLGRLEKRLYGFRRHERRRTAAEEDRRQWPPIGQPRLMRHVRESRVPPLLLVHSLAHMAVEIAIRPFGNANRPMNIERQRTRSGVANKIGRESGGEREGQNV